MATDQTRELSDERMELLYEAIKNVLGYHKLTHQMMDEDMHFPLVDALTPKGDKSIARGQEEIVYLCDAIFNDEAVRAVIAADRAARAAPADVERLRDAVKDRVAEEVGRATCSKADRLAAKRATDAAIDALAAACTRAPAVPAEITKIIENLHTQDNRITDNPLFAVQQKRQICGLDDGYEESWVWVNGDCEEITDKEEIARLDAAFDAGDDTPGARRVGVAESWEFVTGCLTEQGCRDYIARNGHNLREPRIYAYDSYRNAEFIALRKWLMGMRDATPTARSDAAPRVEG